VSPYRGRGIFLSVAGEDLRSSVLSSASEGGRRTLASPPWRMGTSCGFKICALGSTPLSLRARFTQKRTPRISIPAPPSLISSSPIPSACHTPRPVSAARGPHANPAAGSEAPHSGTDALPRPPAPPRRSGVGSTAASSHRRPQAGQARTRRSAGNALCRRRPSRPGSPTDALGYDRGRGKFVVDRGSGGWLDCYSPGRPPPRLVRGSPRPTGRGWAVLVVAIYRDQTSGQPFGRVANARGPHPSTSPSHHALREPLRSRPYAALLRQACTSSLPRRIRPPPCVATPPFTLAHDASSSEV
jgi:hypothetical protein